MKLNQIRKSGIFHPRVLLAVSLSSLGMVLALASFLSSPQRLAAQTPSGARIFVTNTTQKIGPIGTGGCSLQEAIYSSVLHISLDGGAHGVAIDATDPDHFIPTECAMGTGNGDTIILPVNGMFNLSESLDGDAYNYMGPTATPMIFSTMTIEAYGATLAWTGKGNSRLFAIGQATVTTPNGTVYGIGNLTLRNAYIKGFHVKGGDGAGGGLGAGGAIFVQNAALTVENSTFDSNSAIGGNSLSVIGGGGGMGGNGGQSITGTAAGGGGGARGSGGNSGSHAGGGGGGTVFNGGKGASGHGGPGGLYCGGAGGGNGSDGHNALCAGGGGGGGDNYEHLGTVTYDGGDGKYGGGGGGSGYARAGSGGFGGGGAEGGGTAGNGGFGAGGGFCAGVDSSCTPGKGGPFGATPGGGAGLGGAIFSDGGALTIRNSTFTNNSVIGGTGESGNGTLNGSDAGGAIFSRNGSLTVLNVTVSGNKSTTAGGGIVAYADGAAASLTLDNTIIANNGGNECYIGAGVSASGVGNLIMSNGSGNFGACPGLVATTDPQLSTLQSPSVTGKYTPTMEIPLYSSAMGVADPGTSLPYDQRFADRPQPDSQGRNGYDIGAFTVCRRYLVGLRYWSCSETHIPPPPQQESLTINASPSSEGTTNPAPGTYNEDVNSVVAIQAIPSSGNHFVNWTGSVADPNNPSTTVMMSQPQTVTANFASGGPSADLYVTVTDGKTSAVAGAQNTYTIVVGNGGPSYVTGAVIKDTFLSIFSGVTYSATQTGGAYGYTVSGSGNINDTVTLPSGTSITYRATGKLSAAATGTFSDKASVTLPSGITDPNTSNNSATDTDPITFKADLNVTITDGKTSATAGSTNTYTMVVTNTGPSNVSGAVIKDTFPSTFTGVTYTATQSGGASGFTASGSGNISNTVTMPTGSKITYKATGTISASATGSISDTATVTAPSGTTDSNTANNSATDTDTL